MLIFYIGYNQGIYNQLTQRKPPVVINFTPDGLIISSRSCILEFHFSYIGYNLTIRLLLTKQ